MLLAGKMVQKKIEDLRINGIRALAILVVVFGHSIIIFDAGWGYYTPAYQSAALETIKHFINVFQMPLFFSISGYCFRFSRGKISNTGYTRFVKGKAKRLLIPFAAFALLWMIPLRLVSNYPYWKDKSLGIILEEIITGKDSGHLWYLACLFLIFLVSGAIAVLIDRCERRIGAEVLIILIAMMTLVALSFLTPLIPNMFYIRDVARYLIWFYFGYYMFACMRKGPKCVVALVAVIVVTAAIVAMVGTKATEGVYPMQFFRNTAGGALISGIIYLIIPEKDNKWVRNISENSFGVYLFHSPLIYPVFCYLGYLKPFAIVAITFGIMFPMAYFLTITLKKFYVGRIILGEV